TFSLPAKEVILIRSNTSTARRKVLLVQTVKERCKMEIERINDNTVKFYISYLDVEERGFSRDEIWFNRDKSEELCGEMMDEVNEEADFVMEGPLWIQVQAMDKGLEVTVTRAQLTKDGQKLDLPDDIEERRKMFASEDAVTPEFDEFEPVF